MTANAGSLNQNPCVSPDDKYIYFNSNRGGKVRIWRIEASGENPAQMTFGESSVETLPQISPDGEWLYFIRRDGQSSAIWRKSMTDNREEQMTDEKKFVSSNFLALSPDGKYIAFQNLTRQIDSENTRQNFQSAVVETGNPQNVKFFNIDGSKAEIYWTPGAAAFEYVNVEPGRNEIRRISLDEDAKRQIIRQFSMEKIFFIARANNSRTFAVSRGQRQLDTILLTNFE